MNAIVDPGFLFSGGEEVFSGGEEVFSGGEEVFSGGGGGI